MVSCIVLYFVFIRYWLFEVKRNCLLKVFEAPPMADYTGKHIDLSYQGQNLGQKMAVWYNYSKIDRNI